MLRFCRRFSVHAGGAPDAEVLWAVPRSDAGKSVAKKERALGRVPSIVFEQEQGQLGGNKRLISGNLKQIERIVQKHGKSFFLSRIFTLAIYPHVNAPEPEFLEKVLPRTVHFHAGTEKLLNVTFIKVSPDSRLTVNVPLVFLGEDVCPGIKKGGYLNTVRRTACYSCPGDAIPQFVEVDLSNLDLGSSVLLQDLVVAPQLKLCRAEASWPVCKMMGSRYVESEK